MVQIVNQAKWFHISLENQEFFVPHPSFHSCSSLLVFPKTQIVIGQKKKKRRKKLITMGNQVAMACRVARQGATCECDGLIQLGAKMGGEGLAQRVEVRRSSHSLKRSLLGYPRMSCVSLS